MKKALFSLVAMLIAAASVAQNQQPRGPMRPATLEGTYQYCIMQKDDSGKVDIKFAPIIKTLDANGCYSELVARSTGVSVMSEQGTYKKTSDSTFVVTCQEGRPGEEKTVESTYTYKLAGLWLVLEYNDAEGKQHQEVWMRVFKTPQAKEAVKSLKEGGDASVLDRRGPRRGMNGMFGPGQRGQMRQGGARMQRGNNGGGNNNGPEEHSWMNED